MRYLLIMLSLLIVVVSCGKKGNQNNISDTDDSKFTRTVTGNYILFDSMYRWHSNATGDTTMTTHYSVSREITTVFEAVANYIVAGNDTFRYNDTYPSYAGYYSYYSNPNDCDRIILTNDTVKISYSRYTGGHQYVSRIITGRKK